MKSAKWLSLAVLLLAGVLAAESVLAHGRYRHQRHFRSHVGVFVGVPLFVPRYYYPPPYYYYPPVVTVPTSPPVYIEQGSSEAAPAQSDWWYYCADAKAYYPYVKHCPGGWQREAPRPPPS